MTRKLFSLLYTLLILAIGQTALAAKTDPPGTLNGTVTDKADSSKMPGVVVSIPDLKFTTATNDKGVYTFTNLPKGTHLVQFTFIGYATVTRTVDFGTTTTLDVQLQASAIEASEVIVTGVSNVCSIRNLVFKNSIKLSPSKALLVLPMSIPTCCIRKE